MNGFIVEAVCSALEKELSSRDFSLEDIREAVQEVLDRTLLSVPGCAVQAASFTPNRSGIDREKMDEMVLEDLSMSELEASIRETEREIAQMEQQRSKADNKRRRAKTPEERAFAKKERAKITEQIAPLRKKMKQLKRIQEKVPALYELLKTENQLEKPGREKVRSRVR